MREPTWQPFSWHGAHCPRCGRVFHFIWTARRHNRACLLEPVLTFLPPAPALSLKCKIYADRPHQPCSGTTDESVPRSCTCICHVPTGYLGAFRVFLPYSTTNLSRDPDDPYDPDDDPPFTIVDGPG